MKRFSLSRKALITASAAFLLTVGLWQANAQSVKNQAQFDEAVNAYEAGDYILAFKTWLPLAYEEDPAAQRNLAHLYRMGLGVKQDFAKAADWYRKAAELGLARAQANLANMYLRGQGVEKNASEAAQQGHTISQYNMGLIYEHGLGTDADDVEAVKWYYLASKSGHAKALSKRALLISKNAPPELARLITGKKPATELAQAAVAPAVSPQPAPATDVTQKSTATPPADDTVQVAAAAATQNTDKSPATHNAALPPKRPDAVLAELPTPKLPPAEAARSTVDAELPAPQSRGLLTTLKSLFSPGQTEQADTGDSDRRGGATPAPVDDSSTNAQIAAVTPTAPEANSETQTAPVKPIPVVPVSSILDAGLIAYRARDYRTALTNWLPLAQQGNDNAQFFVGGLYADGAGVPRDVVRAHVWWSLEAATGHDTATQFLENLKLEMEPDQIVAASLLAKSFDK